MFALLILLSCSLMDFVEPPPELEAPSLSPLRLEFLEDNQLQLGGRVVDKEQLKKALTGAADQDPDSTLYIVAAPSIEYSRITEVMHLAQSCGITQLGIETN